MFVIWFLDSARLIRVVGCFFFVGLFKARVVDCFCTFRGLCLRVWIVSFWRGLDFVCLGSVLFVFGEDWEF